MEPLEPFAVESVEVDQSSQAVVRQAAGGPAYFTVRFDRPLTEIERDKVRRTMAVIAGNPETLILRQLGARKFEFAAFDAQSVENLFEAISLYAAEWTDDALEEESRAESELAELQKRFGL